MNFDLISFHDSQIKKVIENPNGQILEFIIEFPTNWEENIFEEKKLKFENVTFYSIEEIPYIGLPVILNIEDLGEEKKDFSTEKNEWKTLRKKLKIETNIGNRIIEFSDCSLSEVQ